MRLSRTPGIPLDKEVIQTNIKRVTDTWEHSLQWQLFICALIISDFLMVGLAYRLAYIIRFDAGIPIFKLEVVPSLNFYMSSGLHLNPRLAGTFWAF